MSVPTPRQKKRLRKKAARKAATGTTTRSGVTETGGRGQKSQDKS